MRGDRVEPGRRQMTKQNQESRVDDSQYDRPLATASENELVPRR